MCIDTLKAENPPLMLLWNAEKDMREYRRIYGYLIIAGIDPTNDGFIERFMFMRRSGERKSARHQGNEQR